MATSKNLIVNISRICILVCTALTFISCNKKSIPETTEQPKPTAVFALVVDYSELDGCTYLLELSDGQKLQPVNLREDLQRKGLKLFITYKNHDGVSTCMAGKMVTITSAEIAKIDKTR